EARRAPRDRSSKGATTRRPRAGTRAAPYGILRAGEIMHSLDVTFRFARHAFFFVAVPIAAIACSSSSDPSGGGEDTANFVGASFGAADVSASIAKYDAQRNKDPIAPFQDQTRIEGCWTNPAANHPCKRGGQCAPWTDLKKAFYCKQPLEFRI